MRCFCIFLLLLTICSLASCGTLSIETQTVSEKFTEEENVVLPDVPEGFSFERPEIELNIIPPLDSGRVSSLFGMRKNPVTGAYKFHSGYDIAAPYGTAVKCVMDGTAKKCGFDSGYGNYVIVSHNNNIDTLYAHMSNILIDNNDTINQGDKIGEVGSTGAATGSHLHFELIIKNCKYDPEWVLCGVYN